MSALGELVLYVLIVQRTPANGNPISQYVLADIVMSDVFAGFRANRLLAESFDFPLSERYIWTLIVGLERGPAVLDLHQLDVFPGPGGSNAGVKRNRRVEQWLKVVSPEAIAIADQFPRSRPLDELAWAT